MTVHVEGLPGPVKVEFVQRLGEDWQDLADTLEISSTEQAAFPQGREGRAILNWMVQRGRLLSELTKALIFIRRKDLACLAMLGAIKALSAGQRQTLQACFEQPAVSVDLLRHWCRQVVLDPSSVPVPSDGDSVDLLLWLLERGKLLLTVLQRYRSEAPSGQQVAALQEVVDSLQLHFGEVAAPPPPPSTSSAKPKRPVLLLEIMPQVGTSEYCNIRGLLFDASGRCTQVLPTLDMSEMVDLGSDDRLMDIVDHLRALATDQAIEPENLLVEFLLPRDRLGDPVEQWPNRIREPLGAEFPVVVRPRERHLARESRSLQAGWPHLCDRLLDCEESVLPDYLWWCDADQIRALPARVRAGACIGLSDVPHLGADELGNPVFQVIYCGGPVVFWRRRAGDPQGFKAEMENYLRDRSLRDLPALIRSMRSALWTAKNEHSPCFHLTLLWDDARRPIVAAAGDDGAVYLEAPTT